MALHKVKAASRESTNSFTTADGRERTITRARQSAAASWRVSFYLRGERKFIRLGRMAERAAESIDSKIQELADFVNASRPPAAQLSSWVDEIEPELADKLAKAGLIAPRSPQAPPPVVTLPVFLDGYIRERNAKAGTKINFMLVRNRLVEFFGADRDITTIIEGEAYKFRLWLSRPKIEGAKGLGANTVRRCCGRAKQFFRQAVRDGLRADNPFGDMRDCTVQENTERDYFLERADAAKVLEACPDAEWRLIFALARYGGLRIPSELLALRWTDVDLPAGRLTIHSPKTEHHTGKATRVVPVFAELRPYLEDCEALAEPGTEFVINRYRHKNANLRTQLERIIERAGLRPWPKLFQNLRATRATELADEYPEHVAAEWMGHSRKVAQKHYWRVTDAHFTKATKAAVIPPQERATDGGTDGGTVVAQTVAPSGHDTETTWHDSEPEIPENCRELAGTGVSCVDQSVTPRGIEPLLPP